MHRVALLIGVALLLAGCGGGGRSPQTEDKTPSHARVIVMPLPNGGSVTCVLYSSYIGNSLSCGWGNR